MTSEVLHRCEHRESKRETGTTARTGMARISLTAGCNREKKQTSYRKTRLQGRTDLNDQYPLWRNSTPASTQTKRNNDENPMQDCGSRHNRKKFCSNKLQKTAGTTGTTHAAYSLLNLQGNSQWTRRLTRPEWTQSRMDGTVTKAPTSAPTN